MYNKGTKRKGSNKMETIELVITLPKTFYEELKTVAETNDEVKHMMLANAIVNGKVLPKKE